MMCFETERLEVKCLSAQDRKAVIDLLTDDQVKQFYMVPDFSSREEAAPLFERLRQLSVGEDRQVAGIFLDGQCIGIMNEVETKDKRIEIGYAILPKFHNSGYCTEALKGAI